MTNSIPAHPDIITTRRYWQLEKWNAEDKAWEAQVAFHNDEQARQLMNGLACEKKQQRLDVTQGGNLWAWDEAPGRVTTWRLREVEVSL